jgi:hypothetical protein
VHDSVQFDITKSKSFREEDVGCVCIDFWGVETVV